MAKIQFATALLLIAISGLCCDAQKQRLRSARLIQGNHKLARQEVDVPVTPYPSADELKPDVPFDESSPAADDPGTDGVVVVSGLSPDEVPEIPIVYNTPEEVYGPPKFDFALPADVALARQKVRYARLVQARRQAAYRQAKLFKLAKLRVAKKSTL